MAGDQLVSEKRDEIIDEYQRQLRMSLMEFKFTGIIPSVDDLRADIAKFKSLELMNVLYATPTRFLTSAHMNFSDMLDNSEVKMKEIIDHAANMEGFKPYLLNRMKQLLDVK